MGRSQSVRHRWGILALTWLCFGRTVMPDATPGTNLRWLDSLMSGQCSVSAHVKRASRGLKFGRRDYQAVHVTKGVLIG